MQSVMQQAYDYRSVCSGEGNPMHGNGVGGCIGVEASGYMDDIDFQIL